MSPCLLNCFTVFDSFYFIAYKLFSQSIPPGNLNSSAIYACYFEPTADRIEVAELASAMCKMSKLTADQFIFYVNIYKYILYSVAHLIICIIVFIVLMVCSK